MGSIFTSSLSDLFEIPKQPGSNPTIFEPGLQIFLWDTETNSKSQKTESKTSWTKLLLQGKILIIAGAILSSTSPMAILEPCLPIWLQTNIKPKVIFEFS